VCIDKYLLLSDNIFIESKCWEMRILAAMSRHNISLEPEVYEEFCKYAAKHGIKVSTWINQQMKEFIEDQKELERIKEERKRR
jgi:sugar phosphate isomerase/epimerase